MSTLVLDAGALIALERGNRRAWVRLEEAGVAAVAVLVPVGALAQTWRGYRHQTLLARALKKCHEVHFDGQTAREVGELCGRAHTDDVIDASVAITVARASTRGKVDVLTSDRDDIVRLLSALNAPANVVDI